MDIGCYPISLSRYIFDTEPNRVKGELEIDPNFQIDRLASGVMDFGAGTATFTASTQINSYQRTNILGTLGRIEIEIPFNAPPDAPTRMWLQRGQEIKEFHLNLKNKHGKARALAIISHKLGRTVYYMLKNKSRFREAIRLTQVTWGQVL